MGRRNEAPPSTRAERDAALVQHLRDCAATCRSDTARPYSPLPVTRERLQFDPPRAPMMSGAAGTRHVLLIPGLAEKFDRVVPGSHRTTVGDQAAVACSCGGEPGAGSITPLTPNEIVACEDECGRFFLLTGDDVLLVARFPMDDDEEAAA